MPSPFRAPLLLVTMMAASPALAQSQLERVPALGTATPLHAEARGDGISVLALGKDRGLFHVTIDGDGSSEDRGTLIGSTGERYAGQVKKTGNTLHLAGRVASEQAFNMLLGEAESLVFAPSGTSETEAVLYRFTPEGKELGVSFIGQQAGDVAFAATEEGRYYIGNSETDIVVSFTTEGRKSKTTRAEYEADRGIVTGLQGVHKLDLLEGGRYLLALDSVIGEMRLVDTATRRARNREAPLLRRNRGWVNVTVEEGQSRMVVTDTFRAVGGKKGGPFDARLGVLSYGLDPYNVTELIAFDVGALFFHDLNASKAVAGQTQEAASVRVVFDATGETFAAWSPLSRNVVLYRLRAEYLERINVVTLPERVRTVVFAGPDSVLVQAGSATHMYADVNEWQERNRLFAGVDIIRAAQLELSVLFASYPATRLRLVDGFFGDDTERLFRLYARESGIELPENLSGRRNARLAAGRILESIDARAEAAAASPEPVMMVMPNPDPENVPPKLSKTVRERDLVAAGVIVSRAKAAKLSGINGIDWRPCDLTKNDRFILELSFTSLEVARMPVVCPRTDKAGGERSIQLDFYTAEQAYDGVSVRRDPSSWRFDCNIMRHYVDGEIAIPLSDPAQGQRPVKENQDRLRRVIAIQSGWSAVNDLCFGGEASLGK